MKFLTSLHNHTSSDPHDPITYSDKELINHAAKKGVKVLAITCHNHYVGSEELTNYARGKGILLIHGTEQSVTPTRHVVILNATKSAENIHTFAALRTYKKEYSDCFILSAHTYFPGLNMFNDLVQKNIDCFDGIECSWWYSKLINFNKRGQALAKKHNLPFIGTSDTHSLKNFGKTHCEIYAKKLELKAILKALKQGNIKNLTVPIPTWEMLILMPFIVIRDKTWLLKESLIKKFKGLKSTGEQVVEK
ncbi:MAG: hypothetical protein ACD_65C00292G0005 [uncultured bacterium]|nr:MAG: hypothetical protein ACD_65C00292G0005 [uncultured bacterium]KKT02920.1 MAG: hypothetical protein UV80_C0001G0022 [Candidatus Peregrinibacteria bacterium GW2011_GWF2_43_17]KKT20380.1 MAG: PHP domain protein [Candidatus Peregrinibacteria bacterium GW2011_GWA2_43_8]HAU40265.1 hypothetical protein [Candidatus Peregrinibacteria bacterium]